MNRTAAWLVVAVLAGCARAGSGDGASADDSAMKTADSPQVRPVDSTAAPVVITLRRDSLGIAPQESMQQVTARIEGALPRLRNVADFDVLAISPAILAVNARPKAPMTPDNLIAALRTHPLVQSVERSAVQRVP